MDYIYLWWYYDGEWWHIIFQYSVHTCSEIIIIINKYWLVLCKFVCCIYYDYMQETIVGNIYLLQYIE